PEIARIDARTVSVRHEALGEMRFELEQEASMLFTENETNLAKLYNYPNASGVAKDGFHDYVIHGLKDAVHPDRGTKFAPHYKVNVPAKGHVVLRFRLRSVSGSVPLATPAGASAAELDGIIDGRKREADEFYDTKMRHTLSADQHHVIRQAYAGLLWTKQ